MSSATEPPNERKLSETEFLRRQAEQAKAGVGIALNQAKTALVGKVDPRKITRKHPVLAIISATIGGFIVALLAIPSREEQELRQLERLHRATHPEPPTNGKPAGHPPAAKPSILVTILHEAIALIKPILLAAITAGIKSAAPPPARTENAKAPPPG